MSAVVATPLLSPVSVAAIYVTLGIILAIGLDLLLRKPGRRREESRARDRTPLPPGVDPINLRKRRPLAQKLSGAVLVAAVLVLLLALAPVLGA